MSEHLNGSDTGARLAGTDQLEILLFSLGTDADSGRTEAYGIDVIEVREVLRAPVITRAPEMPPSVEGMASLRGTLVPVIDLARCAGVHTETSGQVMIVTERDGSMQGFLVDAVETILRLDRAALKVPPVMLTRKTAGLVNAVTELPDSRLVMMIDVDRLPAETMPGSLAAAPRPHPDPVARTHVRLLASAERAPASPAQDARGRAQTLDARHDGAAEGCMELLLFSLGGTETYGISVFKVREVAMTPRITPTPHMPACVRGVIALRGSVIPVFDLARILGGTTAVEGCSTLLVTELCGSVQGFLVESVDRIARIAWDKVKTPRAALTGNDGMVSAISRLADGRLISILDVEQILTDAFGTRAAPEVDALADGADITVLFADDSPVARREITHVLDELGVRHTQAANGKEAWDKLQALASTAQAEGARLSTRLRLVLTDAEMPEMDGYALARRIKSDQRFEGIPVVMHTSLSAHANNVLGAGIGIDAWVGKFDAALLANTLRPLLARPALAA